MGYIMEEAEYNALDKALTEAHYYDAGIFIYQDADLGDCIAMYDNEFSEELQTKVIATKAEDGENDIIYIVPLLDGGLEEICDGFSDMVECYGFTETDCKAFEGLCKKAGFEFTCE